MRKNKCFSENEYNNIIKNGYEYYKKNCKNIFIPNKLKYLYSYIVSLFEKDSEKFAIIYVDNVGNKNFCCPVCRRSIDVDNKNNIPNYCECCGQKITFTYFEM